MKFDLNLENTNYIKITYKDKEGFAHCIKSAIKLINDFEIQASAKQENKLNIETPQEVEIGIAFDNCLYKAKSILKRVEQAEEFLIFYIKKPEETEYQQKREFFRVRLQEDANIIFETENESVTKLSALTYDISANGVRIELENKYAFPQRVRILLFLSEKTIDAKAKYIRTDEDEGVIKASFQFENISESDLDYISQICFKKQLEERRKNFL